MPLFDRPPIDAVSVSNTLFSSGTFRITGGPGINVGSDASGAVVSEIPRVGSFFENAVPNMGMISDSSLSQTFWGAALASTSVNTNLAGGRLLIQPVTPSNELFPMEISATQINLNFSGGVTASNANFSAAYTSSFLLGFYTRVNSTQLSLINSGSRTTAAGASTANFSRIVGPRYLSFHSSNFSVPPVFTEGGRYWFAQLIRTSGAIYTGAAASGSLASSNSHFWQLGMYHAASVQRSGQFGEAVASNTSSNAWYPFMGVHSLTTHTALPATLGNADINKASVNANWIPHLVFNGGLALVD